MSDFIVLGTDTDVGKTTFALLWLAAFGDRYAYWKPVETGPSDSQRVEHLLPDVRVHAPLVRLTDPVAPPLAARRQHQIIPPARELAQQRPLTTAHSLLVETFGSPFSPLNDTELQIELIQLLALPCVLVAPTRLGTIGQTLQCMLALHGKGHRPQAVVLLGPEDEYAAKALAGHLDVPILALRLPRSWDGPGFAEAAKTRCATLVKAAALFSAKPFAKESIGSQEEILALDQAVLWHPYTPLRSSAPLLCVGAKDEFLHLADGRKIVDGISSWWTILYGHRDPLLVRALAEASAQIDHVLFAGVTHPWAILLGDLLLRSANMRGGRVFFSDNGSTAVEVALKMAYQFWCLAGEPQRRRFVGFQHGYHGDTFGAMAVSRDRVFFNRFEPLLFAADIVPLDAAMLDEHLAGRNDVAAVILEPLVQGAGGMRMHGPGVLADIYEVVRRHDVLFIADEVMTGGGRTGSLWAFQQAGIEPDLVCAAKTLAGGLLPLAATLAAARIVAAFDSDDRTGTFYHGHSFTAHPLACAVALTNWRRLLLHPPQAPRQFAAFWRQHLEPLREHPKVQNVRIKGSIAAVEVACPGEYLAEIGPLMHRAALDEDVLLRSLGNVLYALPPYGCSEASLLSIVRAMKRAIEATM